MADELSKEALKIAEFVKAWYDPDHKHIEDFRAAMYDGDRESKSSHKPSSKSQSLRQKLKRYVLGGDKKEWGNKDFEPRYDHLCERAEDGKGWVVRALESENSQGGGGAVKLTKEQSRKAVGKIVWKKKKA